MIDRTPTARLVLVALAAAALVTAPAALADKGGKPGTGGGGSSTSTVTLVLLDGATEPTHGGRVTFRVSTTATDRPFVGVRCYQGANFVYDGYVGFFPTYMFDPWLTLDSPYWAAGVEASCTARLFYYDKRGNQKVLTTISFPVAP